MAKIKFMFKQSFEREEATMQDAEQTKEFMRGMIEEEITKFNKIENIDFNFDYAIVDLGDLDLIKVSKHKMQERYASLFSEFTRGEQGFYLDKAKVKKLCQKYEELLQDFLFVTELNKQINRRYEDVINVILKPAEIEEIKAGIVTKDIENKLNLLWKVAHAYEKGTNQEIKDINKKPEIKK